MIAIIAHWTGQIPPVPEAIKRPIPGYNLEQWTVDLEIEDLANFIQKYGAMIVVPPGSEPFKDHWLLWYNGGKSKFTQS